MLLPELKKDRNRCDISLVFKDQGKDFDYKKLPNFKSVENLLQKTN